MQIYLGLVRVVNLNFGYCKANLEGNLGWNTGRTHADGEHDLHHSRPRLLWKDYFLNLETRWQIYGYCSSQLVEDLKGIYKIGQIRPIKVIKIEKKLNEIEQN